MKKIGVWIFSLGCSVVGSVAVASPSAPAVPPYQSVAEVYTSGPNAGKPVYIPAVTRYGEAPYLRGINFSGLEYGGDFGSALQERPDLPDMLYFAAQGMNFVRLPIRAEYIVPDPDNPNNLVNMDYLGAVYDTVQKFLTDGISVDLDLHNNMRFCPMDSAHHVGDSSDPVNSKCALLTDVQLAHIWTLILTAQLNIPGISGTVTLAGLAQKYTPQDPKYGTPQLIFGVMDAPFDDAPSQALRAETVFDNEVAAVKAIRASAPHNLILLSGDNWSSLHFWMTQVSNNANVFTAQALKSKGVDPSEIAIEVQEYFNWDYSGLTDICNHYDDYQSFQEDMGLMDGAGRDIFGAWMQQNGFKVMVSEFGGADSPDCRQDIIWLLQYVDTHGYDPKNPNQGGFIGWAAWHANRHDAGKVPFNFLQQANSSVYAPQGIVQGSANGLMSQVLSHYLVPPQQ